jgi:cytochrome c553
MLLALVSFLMGGDYHYGESLICYDCHVMHYSQEHGYNPDGSGTFTPLGAGGPFEYLLRDEVNSLCLSCHDNQAFAPDVFMSNILSNVRQAGALNDITDQAPYYMATGHTLGSTDEAPGSDPEWAPDPEEGLTCVDCHQPHGWNPNGNAWRNLKHDPGNYSYPGVIVTYAVGTNDLTKDVFEITNNGVAEHYDISNVWFNEPDETNSAMATWCKGCHTNFHGDIGGPEIGGEGDPPEEFVRHPAAGVDIGALGGGHSSSSQFASWISRVKFMDPLGDWDNINGDETPTCISCHKAHGNQNPFGLIYMKGDEEPITEEGTANGQYRDLCRQCHIQGGS